MQLITIREAARMLGIESRAVKREGNRLWELLRAKRIDVPYVRVGRRYMFNPEAVIEWERSHRNGGGR